MKHCLKPVYALIALAMFSIVPGHASDEKNMVISIETDSINLTEMDVGSLAIGESKTIETDSGQVIDLLRTVDNVEIYIDGELVDIGFGQNPDSAVHIIKKHVEITCDDEDEDACEKHLVIHADGDYDFSAWSVEGEEETLGHDDIEITCITEEDESECISHVVWVNDGDEIEIESLHPEHVDGEQHKIIVIEKKADSHD